MAKKIIDITGVELTPGEPDNCLGNGEWGFECCCDECDYFLEYLYSYILLSAYKKCANRSQRTEKRQLQLSPNNLFIA